MNERWFKTVRRTWWERLWSLTPWVGTKEVRDYERETEMANRAFNEAINARRAVQNKRDLRAMGNYRTHAPPRPVSPPAPAPLEDGSLLDLVSVAAVLILGGDKEPKGEDKEPFKSGGGGNFGGGGADASYADPLKEERERGEVYHLRQYGDVSKEDLDAYGARHSRSEFTADGAVMSDTSTPSPPPAPAPYEAPSPSPAPEPSPSPSPSSDSYLSSTD